MNIRKTPLQSIPVIFLAVVMKTFDSIVCSVLHGAPSFMLLIHICKALLLWIGREFPRLEEHIFKVCCLLEVMSEDQLNHIRDDQVGMLL